MTLIFVYGKDILPIRSILRFFVDKNSVKKRVYICFHFQRCPDVPTVTCNDGETLCPGETLSNGCRNPDFCVPPSYGAGKSSRGHR